MVNNETLLKEIQLKNDYMMQSLKDKKEMQKKALGVIAGIAGLVGIYFNIPYSGWLIFMGFCLL